MLDGYSLWSRYWATLLGSPPRLGAAGSIQTNGATTSLVIPDAPRKRMRVRKGLVAVAAVAAAIAAAFTGPLVTSTVYAFQVTDAPLTQLLEVNGASTDNGAVADTRRRTLNSDGTIQANQQWAYKFNGTTGEGEIVNASSGKCLELNRSDAKIDQWDCIDGADNEQWKLVPNRSGGTALQINLTAGPDGHPGTYYLATTTDPASMTNGTQLTLTTSQNDRTAWDVLKQAG